MLPSLDWRSPHQPTSSWCRIHSRTHNPLRVTVWETAGPSRQGNRPTGTVSLSQITGAGSHNPITTPEQCHSYARAFSDRKRWLPTKQTIFSFSIVSHQAPHVFRVFIMRSVQKSAVQFSPIDSRLSDLKIDPAFLSTMSNLQSKRFKCI